ARRLALVVDGAHCRRQANRTLGQWLVGFVEVKPLGPDHQERLVPFGEVGTGWGRHGQPADTLDLDIDALAAPAPDYTGNEIGIAQKTGDEGRGRIDIDM